MCLSINTCVHTTAFLLIKQLLGLSPYPYADLHRNYFWDQKLLSICLKFVQWVQKLLEGRAQTDVENMKENPVSLENEVNNFLLP